MRIPRKIIFLPRWYPTENDPQNGIFIQKHARAAALENQVVVLHAEPFFKKDQRLTRTGNLIEIIMYYKQSTLPLIGKIINLFNYMMAFHHGWNAVKKSGFVPEIIHIHVLTKPVFPALLLKLQLNIPHIVSEHWSGYYTGAFSRKNFFSKFLAKIILKKAAAVSVVSEFLKDAMEKTGLKADYRIIQNVVELPQTNAIQLPLQQSFTFLAVADLNDDIKNITGIIKAFARVNKENATPQLIIAGEGKDRKHLESLTRTFNMENCCTFTGRLNNEDVLKLIRRAHIIVVNSNVETFSVLTLESIFSGRPVIATKCGGPEPFINSQNGKLIEKNDDKALAEAMETMMHDYKKYDPQKVKNSLQNIYDLETIGQKLSALYDEVIASK